MKKFIKSLVVVLVVVLAIPLFTACTGGAKIGNIGSSEGREFIGKWKVVANNRINMVPIEITCAGDQYICEKINDHTKVGAGIYKDGAIDLGVFKVTYLKSSDTLLASSSVGPFELKRIK